MTNGELFIAENPNFEFKLNGSCVWIYFDSVNHYTMPVEWWDKEISLFNKIRAEIEQLRLHKAQFLTSDNKVCIDSQEVLNVIDKYKAEGSNKK